MQQQFRPLNNQAQQQQPVCDPFAMEIDASRIAANATMTPSPKKLVSLDADGCVIGGRAELSAAGACFYCKLPGHMTLTCPAIARKNTKASGTYTPLQWPNNSFSRSCGMSIVSSEISEQILLPVPLYERSQLGTESLSGSIADYSGSDLGFVVGQE